MAEVGPPVTHVLFWPDGTTHRYTRIVAQPASSPSKRTNASLCYRSHESPSDRQLHCHGEHEPAKFKCPCRPLSKCDHAVEGLHLAEKTLGQSLDQEPSEQSWPVSLHPDDSYPKQTPATLGDTPPPQPLQLESMARDARVHQPRD